MYYIKTFLSYSIFGYLFETIVSLFTKSNFKSGIMFGPWTPIYGLGVLIIMCLSKYLFLNLHMNRILETIITFCIITITLTFLEWLGGVLIEFLFHKVFWNYANHVFNFGKYISLTVSLVWGIGSIIFIYIINPLLNDLIKKIPNSLAIIIFIIFIIDFILTFAKNLRI